VPLPAGTGRARRATPGRQQIASWISFDSPLLRWADTMVWLPLPLNLFTIARCREITSLKRNALEAPECSVGCSGSVGLEGVKMAVESDSSELPRASGIAPSRNWRRAVPSDSRIMAIARHPSCRMLKRYRRSDGSEAAVLAARTKTEGHGTTRDTNVTGVSAGPI
jgi:hypothetical protein